jgi:phosphoglycolate phosphatase-like HAD superfamily hydrolase
MKTLFSGTTVCNFPPFNTILFDVDGVLIKTIDSFHATDIATTEYVGFDSWT